jgi:hypothetical protein
MRDRLPSSPLLESHDEPRAISPAVFEAHLVAHQQIDDRLRAIEATKSDSTALKGPGGWAIKGPSRYLVVVLLFALADVALWIWTRR